MKPKERLPERHEDAQTSPSLWCCSHAAKANGLRTYMTQLEPQSRIRASLATQSVPLGCCGLTDIRKASGRVWLSGTWMQRGHIGLRSSLDSIHSVPNERSTLHSHSISNYQTSSTRMSTNEGGQGPINTWLDDNLSTMKYNDLKKGAQPYLDYHAALYWQRLGCAVALPPPPEDWRWRLARELEKRDRQNAAGAQT